MSIHGPSVFSSTRGGFRGESDVEAARQDERLAMVGKIQGLSHLIGRLSPPMKPFVRFACPDSNGAVLFWDFDDLLQKKLMSLLRRIAGPEDIPGMNIVRWKRNLAQLRLPHAKTGCRVPAPDKGLPGGRHGRMAGRFNRGHRVLYVGCGTGWECFLLGEEGIRVTGIDTFSELLYPAGKEGRDRGLPVSFSAMDMSALGFRDLAFDGFLLELYGFLPPGHQNVRLLRELARVLKTGGTGFVVALRKAYASHWLRGGSPFPPSLAGWLAPQSALDFRFGERDACEERLVDGFYNRCHTVDSLPAELSGVFDVLACDYEEDPRYVVAVVRAKEEMDLQAMAPESVCRHRCDELKEGMAEIEQEIARVEEACRMMAGHASEVASFFAAGGTGRDCLRQVRPDLGRFTGLLDSLSLSAAGGCACRH